MQLKPCFIAAMFLLPSLLMVSTFVSAGSVIIRNGGLNVNNSLYTDPSTGLVGIGTTSPVRNLDVVGVINATSQVCIAGDCRGAWPAAAGASGWSVSGNYLYNNTAGVSVGIGTSSPVSLLSLYKTGNSNTMLNISNGTVNAGIYAGDLSGGYAGASIGTNSNHVFNIFTNSVDRLTADTSGNVGISTSSPNKRLHIADVSLTGTTITNNEGQLAIEGSQNADTLTSLVFERATIPVAKIAAQYTASGSKLNFLTSNSYGTGITTNVMTLDYNGKVGINTTSPVNALNVVGDANITGDFLYGCPNTATNQMVKVGSFCIDKYEAYTVSGSLGNANGNNTNAVAGSKAGVLPQTSVTWFQAAQECANAGKRLCTNAEWQTAVAGTPDPGADGGTTGCNVASRGTPNTTGYFTACVSRWGAYDMVGNVWEWVADWGQAGWTWQTSDGQYTNTAWPDATYGADGTWNVNGRTYNGAAWVSGAPGAFIRGGGWGDGANAGSFALGLGDAPSSSHTALGFRCCK